MNPTATAASPPAAPIGFTRTDALLGLMVLVWGVNYIVIKASLREISPLAFNAVRFALAAVIVGIIARIAGSPKLERRDWGRLFLMGMMGNGVYQFLFIQGVAHTRAGNASLLFASVPVQTAVLSHLAGQDRLRGRDVLGLLVSTAGIVTIVLGSSAAVAFGATIMGDLLTLGATVLWSIYIVGSKPLADRYGSIAATAWTMSIGAIPIVLFAIPALRAQPWAAVSATAWTGLFLSSIGALVVAYLIWFRGVQVLGPARTALYSNFTPVVVMLAAWPMLGERPTAWQVAGAVGIFAGLWLTRT